MKYELRTRPTRLMESYFSDDMMNSLTYGSQLDIYKKEDKFLVELEIPGFEKDDIQVEFKGEILSIKAQHKKEEEVEEKNFYYQSRAYKDVHRQVKFSNIDEEKVEATYENGVLEVQLPVKEKTDLVNKIKIK